jgi:hypothetical protein
MKWREVSTGRNAVVSGISNTRRRIVANPDTDDDTLTQGKPLMMLPPEVLKLNSHSGP